MCFDNRAANGQANPQASGLRAVKGIEHPIEIRGVHTRPRISNCNEDSFGVGSVGANSQLPLFLVQAAHGFDRVRDEVQYYLCRTSLPSSFNNSGGSLRPPAVNQGIGVIPQPPLTPMTLEQGSVRTNYHEVPSTPSRERVRHHLDTL